MDQAMLREISDGVFNNCAALRSIVLPSSVERIGQACFCGCRLLSHLTFSSPPILRDVLSLPHGWHGLVAVPVSVEIVRMTREPLDFECTLSFGRHAKLIYAGITLNFQTEWMFLRAQTAIVRVAQCAIISAGFEPQAEDFSIHYGVLELRYHGYLRWKEGEMDEH
jgi:hypothetical protein